MIVTFDEATHTYTVDGETVPSVTQLVAPLGSPMDEMDAMMEGALENAAERGTTMHAYIAHRLQGGIEEDFELPADYADYVDAVELFLSEHTIEPLLVEQPLGGDGYAGTPDLVCIFDGEPTILDYKFVSTVAKSKVGAQLRGYMELCNHNDIYPEKLKAVQFMRGDYRIYDVDTETTLLSWATCQTLHLIKTKKHPRGRIE